MYPILNKTHHEDICGNEDIALHS